LGLHSKKGLFATIKANRESFFWGIMRISLGWIFFWSFLDKTFGLGFATPTKAAWIMGKSPTMGYLKFATRGPFAELYQGLAGNIVVDWFFMIGTLLIGLALILGIGIKIASYTGSILMIIFYTSALWPKNNPVINDFVVYFFLLLAFVDIKAGCHIGLGKWWSQTKLVKRFPFLE
jgi:thiosulfate dehydrogenase [quinone] large subunit